ncbi:MAG: prefoldin subunit alpha [Candidatus Pacearchaeota archaeon]
MEKESKEKQAKEKEEKRIIQERGLQLLALDQELRRIEEQYAILEQNIISLELTKQNLNEVKKIKDKEILANLAEGIFVMAKALENDKVLINVGKNVILEKSSEDAKKIIEARIEELSMLKTILSNEAQKILNEIKTIEEEIKNLQS